jgi:hypothetical protein
VNRAHLPDHESVGSFTFFVNRTMKRPVLTPDNGPTRSSLGTTSEEKRTVRMLLVGHIDFGS